jgi:hypothetical protein
VLLTFAFGSAAAFVVFALAAVFFTGSSKSVPSLSMWKSLSSESDIVLEVVTERLNADRGGRYGTGDLTSGGRWKVAALRETPGFLDEPVQKDCLRRICSKQVATRGLGDRETVLIPIKLRQMLRMRFSNYGCDRQGCGCRGVVLL